MTYENKRVVECKDCKLGHFIVSCREAKTNHELLRYKCDKIRGEHNPHFFCGYGTEKEIDR